MDYSNVEEIITCGICLETFNGDSRCPRMLNCGHTFCQLCLKTLIGQSPRCPTCISGFSFGMVEEIPKNFALKGLIDIRSGVISSTLSSVKDLAVAEAYFELKKQQLSIKVEAELGERKATFEKLDKFLRILEEEKKCLIEEIKKKEQESMRILEEEKKCFLKEIKKKEQELKDRDDRIRDLESLKSDGREFCQNLERVHGLVVSSSIGSDLLKAINQLEKLLESQKTEIPDDLTQLHQPSTIKTQDEDTEVEEEDIEMKRIRDPTLEGKILHQSSLYPSNEELPSTPSSDYCTFYSPFSSFQPTTSSYQNSLPSYPTDSSPSYPTVDSPYYSRVSSSNGGMGSLPNLEEGATNVIWKRTRPQKCRMCANHNRQVDVKGHKWFCKYRECTCPECIITRQTQYYMKQRQRKEKQGLGNGRLSVGMEVPRRPSGNDDAMDIPTYIKELQREAQNLIAQDIFSQLNQACRPKSNLRR